MKKYTKFLLLIICLFSFCFLTSCDMSGLMTPVNPNPSTRTITSVEIDQTTLPSEAILGSFNITDGDLAVNYNDGITEYIDINYGMITPEDLGKLDTIGTHTIIITYNGYTTLYTVEIIEKTTVNVEAIVNEAINAVSITTSATTNFTLPLSKNGVAISWQSNSSSILVSGTNAIVSRPAANASDATVILTATFSYEGVTKTKNYTVVVPKLEAQNPGGNTGGNNNQEGNYTGNYYDSISLTLVGTALKTALSDLVQSTHTKYTTYDYCRDNLKDIDEDPNNPNNMILFYTGESIPKSTNVQTGGDWNREHVWAKSLSWFDTDGAGSDLHHIRPCDQSINSSRGNKKFGTSTNSSYYLPLNVAGSGADYRGDVARIIFYLMIAYDQANSYSFTSIAQSKELLLQWNEQDPVSELEILRNDKVEAIQGNRNPFIDYPYLADSIWG